MQQDMFNFEDNLEKTEKVQKTVLQQEDSVKELVNKEPHVYTISEITSHIREILEITYPDLWITGEVSNLRNPQAKNYYFNLKDDLSAIRVVIFGGRQKLNFDLEDGLEVICHGKISLYNARGEYQVIIDHCEPKGKGALQIAFEQLKKKLESEGLFTKERKRTLPFLPKRVGVITSPTGAAVRDIINVLTRRFPTIEILVIPVKVQGAGSAIEIANAIEEMNKIDDIDVMIVGRGGGSIEDLWAFNEEVVARVIFKSRIPVVSAVGHEIDFTIADFVADKRAATPSAAAEIVVPEMKKLFENIEDLKRQMFLALKQNLINKWTDLQSYKTRLVDPSKRFPDLYIRLDSLSDKLNFILNSQINERDQKIDKLKSNLMHLSPMHILEKGYAVVTSKIEKKAIKSTDKLKMKDEVLIRFHKGFVEASITKKVDG